MAPLGLAAILLALGEEPIGETPEPGPARHFIYVGVGGAFWQDMDRFNLPPQPGWEVGSFNIFGFSAEGEYDY